MKKHTPKKLPKKTSPKASSSDLFTAFNEYKIMWILALFDLPVQTKEQRHYASTFRNDLLNDGFSMLQFSVYIRSCPSRENAQVHKDRIVKMLPPEGLVHIISITDKQYSTTEVYYGAKAKKDTLPSAPQQLELF